jgi:COMPASS component SWD1
MKAEEEEVDIDTVIEDTTRPSSKLQAQEDDEDLAWADEDPDDDAAGWKMKIIMDDEPDI